jgi:UDP-2,4-diacetamido-2,4,6-trideoxy-beta-L-altropyranose hydrolase
MPAIGQQAKAVSLRPAMSADMQRVFDWRNSDFIMERSSSRSRIDWSEHQRWFAEQLNNPRSLMFIVEIGRTPHGIVRFERSSPKEAVVTAYLENAATGHGAGIKAIKDGCLIAVDRLGIRHVVACVRLDNAMGLAAFSKAGFARSADIGQCPPQHARFIWSAT